MGLHIRGKIRRLRLILAKTEEELEQLKLSSDQLGYQVMIDHKAHEIKLLQRQIDELTELLRED